MSQEVLEGQQWLNATYDNRAGYIHVAETGFPGTAMSQALVSAMQIELGVSPATGTFGPLTSSMCDSYPLSKGDYGNRVRIIQYGLLAKGYSPGLADSSFGNLCAAAVTEIQSNAGLSAEQQSETVRGLQAKAILGVDEYKLLPGGDGLVRQQQQWLNRTYLVYTGICACDGIYSRSTSRALVLALQAEEGMPTSMANGNFGPSTKNYCPIVGNDIFGSGHDGTPYPSIKREAFLKLAQIALYCNGIDRYTGSPSSRYGTTTLDGTLTSGTLQALHEFQADYSLTQRDVFGLNEWMALLVSTGNPDRAATACDCSTQLTTTKAAALKNSGYSIVGRYLTGTVGAGSSKRPKNVTSQEAQALFDLEMSFFAIYQDDAEWWQSHDSLREYFSYERGYDDARKAVRAALLLGIDAGEYIYFAVDYDYMAEEVIQRVVPHFQGINDYISSVGSPYRIGIYGSRNTCGTVWGKGLCESSFVSDMSTGFSGNLGYPIPLNWAFDQIKEYEHASSEGSFGIDKNVASGRYTGINSLFEGSSVTSADLKFRRLVGDKGWGVIPSVTLDERWFSSSSLSYNHEIATAAAALSTLVYADASTIMAGICKFGFSISDVRIDSVSGNDPVGYSFATKAMRDGTPLVVVSIRGTANEAEWLSNMDVSGGETSADIHLGFNNASTALHSVLLTWLSEKGIAPGTAKYLVTGHSRGAAVANLIARWLTEADGVPNTHVFGYMYATPNVLVSPLSSANIFNIINPEDFVPRIPLEQWGFGKNGIQLLLPSSSTSGSRWDYLHSKMSQTYKNLTGELHSAFLQGTGPTDDFVRELNRVAPSLQMFYTQQWTGPTQPSYLLSVSEYFSSLAHYLGNDTPGNLATVLEQSTHLPGLGAYFFINSVLNSYLFPAHTPEAYLAWLTSQTNPEVLFQ